MNFILPTTVLRIIDFIGLSPDNEILFQSTDNKYALCKTLENNLVIVNFISNLKKYEISEDTIQKFFVDKAKKSFKDQTVLKLAKILSKDKQKKKELTTRLKEEIKQKNPDMEDEDILMEALEQVSDALETEAKNIIINDRTIKKGSVIRVPLSSNGERFAAFNGHKYPIYDSFSLLMNSKEYEPYDSGMYLFSSNRHSIPLVFKINKNKQYSIRYNSPFGTKDSLITLFKHGIRTFEKTQSYFLTFFINEKLPDTLKDLGKEINECSKREDKKGEYVDLMNQLILWVQENEDEKLSIFKKVYIYLPKQIGKEELFYGSLFADFPKALLNISLKGLEYDDKEEMQNALSEEMNSYFETNNKELYGFYNIVYTIPDEESDTYGFLENNISSHQIMANFNDSLEFLNHLQDKYKDKIKSTTSTQIEKKDKVVDIDF